MSELIKVLYDGNFKIQEVTYEDGSTYELQGYCCQCGECCKNPNYNVGYNDASGVCSKLIYETVDGSVRYRCSIYQNRPVSCLLWPTQQYDIDQHPSCTLKFVKK